MKRNIFFVCITFLLFACGGGENQNKSTGNYKKIEGLTQGTSFHITYKDEVGKDFSVEIDSLLKAIDQSMSVYNENSMISMFNRADSVFDADIHMLRVFWKSMDIFYQSNTSFNPAVKPLIDFWGFGGSKITTIEAIDTAQIDSLLKFTKLTQVKIHDKKNNKILEFMSDIKFENAQDYELVKLDPRVRLDFNAIAQGYTVDLVSELLETNGVVDYLVEIGGEVRVKGKNSKDGDWTIGIDKPTEENELGRPLSAVMTLHNKSVATSGNYRKFYEKDGIKYSHTISAVTGYPVQHKILSATVVADDCMTADAFATAFMVMGHKEAIQFLEQNNFLQGYLIYSDENGGLKTYFTKGMEGMIEEKEL